MLNFEKGNELVSVTVIPGNGGSEEVPITELAKKIEELSKEDPFRVARE